MKTEARDLALEVLRKVDTQGAFASASLRAVLDHERGLDPRDRGLITELVYGVLRRRLQLDRALSSLGKRLKDLDPKLHDVLRLAAYQLIFLDRVPDHAAVDTAVTQARGRRGERGAAQTNAILRKLAGRPRNERLPLPIAVEKEPVRHLSEAASLPHWISESLIASMGLQTALAFGAASLERAPLVLRVNLLRASRAALIEELGATQGNHPRAVILKNALGELPAELPCVLEGRATLQDEAAMRVVDQLDPQPGERILDTCAAPGGKTTYIAEKMGDRGEVVATDRLPEKIAQIARSKDRLGLTSIHTEPLLPDPKASPFDRVLVDAPCSGLGTLRRHPEIRWRLKAEDLSRLSALQNTLLFEGARRVRPGGVLVYAVCTVLEAECEAHFSGRSAEGTVELAGARFALEDTLRTQPSDLGAPDGFFSVRLRRLA